MGSSCTSPVQAGVHAGLFQASGLVILGHHHRGAAESAGGPGDTSRKLSTPSTAPVVPGWHGETTMRFLSSRPRTLSEHQK